MSMTMKGILRCKWVVGTSAALVLAAFLVRAMSDVDVTEKSCEARIAGGWERFAQGEYELAAKEFKEAIRQAPAPSPARLQAIYGLASVHNLRRPGEDRAEARRLYDQVIAEAKDDELAGWSLLALARMRLTAPGAVENGIDADALQRDYQAVVDRFPFQESGEQAFLFQQAARLEGSDQQAVRHVLDALTTFLVTHPETPYRETAISLRAHCYEISGMPQQALDETMNARQAAPTDPLNPVRDAAGFYWGVATRAEFETGDWATARHFYRKLIAEYPTDMRIVLAKQELKRMDERESTLRIELEREGRLP